MAPGSDEILSEPKSLPWGSTDPPDTRFAKLYQAIVEQVGVEESTPKLETLLDNYLRMLWTLSLSAPIDYINKHPFDLTASDDPSYYLIANTPRGQATKVSLKKEETLRSKLDLHARSGVRKPHSGSSWMRSSYVAPSDSTICLRQAMQSRNRCCSLGNVPPT